MTRNEEYQALLQELETTPAALDGAVERALRRRKRDRRLRLFGVPAGSLAACFAAFVLLVNLFPPFARACGSVPVLRELAQAVDREVVRQTGYLERSEIMEESLRDFGCAIVCDSLERCVELANEIAPEHLELCVDNPFDYLGEIQNAGSVFLGRYNPEPMGDYFAGPNHTLPTMGTARFYSPLSVDDFVKKSQFSYYTRDALARDYRKVSLFARKEGLDAHARAVDIRFEGGEA